MNIEKALDAIADMILGVVPWFLSMFGGDPRVRQIQEKVVETCGFLPTATSVAGMLAAATGTAGPVITGVLGIATAICQAVTAGSSMQTLVGAAPLGTVNGVPIEGDFVGGK
jgi:hypothetical protein